MERAHHESVSGSIRSGEHECLSFFIQTAFVGDGIRAVGFLVHKLVVNGHVMREMLQLIRVLSQILDLAFDHLLHIYETPRCGTDNFRQVWRTVHDHILVQLRVLEAYKDRERSVHCFDDGGLEAGSVDGVDG